MRARMQERREIAPSTNVSAESWKLLAAEQKRKSKMDIWMTGFSLCIGHFKQGGGQWANSIRLKPQKCVRLLREGDKVKKNEMLEVGRAAIICMIWGL